MPRSASDLRIFLGEFRRTFHTTGAIVPSGRSLARALTRYIDDNDQELRILEVGPGTGAVTREIIVRMGPRHRLDLVELNDRFVERLRERLDADRIFAKVRERTEILHQSVQEVSGEAVYDVIISGLPLNNFSHIDVETILENFRRLVRPGGTISFFEYIAMRRLRGIVASARDRQRLAAITRTFTELFASHEIRRDAAWLNVPPAWVHHLRLTKHREPR